MFKYRKCRIFSQSGQGQFSANIMIYHWYIMITVLYRWESHKKEGDLCEDDSSQFHARCHFRANHSEQNEEASHRLYIGRVGVNSRFYSIKYSRVHIFTKYSLILPLLKAKCIVCISTGRWTAYCCVSRWAQFPPIPRRQLPPVWSRLKAWGPPTLWLTVYHPQHTLLGTCSQLCTVISHLIGYIINIFQMSHAVCLPRC